MQLKEFQELVLKNLNHYFNVLKSEYLEEKEIVEFHKTKGRDRIITEYPEKTWKKLRANHKLPFSKNKFGELEVLPYLNKTDGLNRPIPNICLKVPTGGGKTLIGVSALENINFHYFGKTTGLVLWVVPTDAIYTQTLKSFKDKTHPYRKVLERTGARKVKILEWRKNKHNSFSMQDLREYLCVFLLTLQSANRETKESLKVFKDSGKFIQFFPSNKDYQANKKLLSQVKNLDTYTSDSILSQSNSRLVKQSLGNAIRIAQPIVILDEGHRAYSDLARKTLSGLNPRFILELSATPNMKEHKSNVLINVSGTKLKQEEMIKLPINVMTMDRGDWQNTLDRAHDKLKKLEQESHKHYRKHKKYIRPIMLIQVERTGKDQTDKDFIHSEEVKDYLIKMGISKRAIKIKTAEKDELKDEDLLSPASPVQFIITKQALQEGWDCPFAYILTILAKSKSKLALTQLIGRILRQAYAERSSIPALNESYVFCYDKKAKEVVEDIRKGLQKEGMEDVLDYVNTEEKGFKQVTAKRKPQFKDTQILLPRILHKSRNNLWRGLIYEQDILQHIDFSKISYSKKGSWTPDNINTLTIKHFSIDMEEETEAFVTARSTREETLSGPVINYPFMIRRLCRFIPNAWEASRIFDETLKALKSKKISDEQIYLNRNGLVIDMEQDIREQVDKLSQEIFLNKLKKGIMCFKVFKDRLNINWALGSTIDFTVSAEDKKLRRDDDDDDFQLSLFDKRYHYQSHYNTLEEKVAQYLDNKEDVVKWWHRMLERKASSYYLQGWRKSKVWPDFLIACETEKSNKKRYMVLETKGDHLDNVDTRYKDQLFKLLELYYKEPLNIKGMQVATPEEQEMAFKMLKETTWQQDLQTTLS